MISLLILMLLVLFPGFWIFLATLIWNSVKEYREAERREIK